jgi:hypothetical protein
MAHDHSHLHSGGQGGHSHSGRTENAAGMSGGIDMALYLVARLKNEQESKSIQTVIEYDPHPPLILHSEASSKTAARARIG